MEELIKVLEKTVSSSQNDQNVAVNYIQDYIQRDFTGFLKALSDVLYNQVNQPVVRAAAGLQLKNQLTAREEHFRHQQQERWRSLDEETRNYIKERVFRTLGTEVFRPSSAPQCVAYIAIVEFPERLWPGVIQALTENITNPTSSAALRFASLEVLGLILKDHEPTSLTQEECDIILATITRPDIQESDQSNDIRSAAITALINFCATKVQKIAKTHENISLDDLGRCLNLDPKYAEKIVAQLIRDERIKGNIDGVNRIVYFETKDVLQVLDEDILKFCADINSVIEVMREVAPEEWWTANVQQAS